MAELSNEGSGIVAASSVAENRPAASRSDTFTVAKVGTAARILVRASSSLSTRNLFDQHSPISNVSLAIGDYSSYSRPTRLVRWLSGRKQRFAKAPYPKRVPRVRIPPSPLHRKTRQKWLSYNGTYNKSARFAPTNAPGNRRTVAGTCSKVILYGNFRESCHGGCLISRSHFSIESYFRLSHGILTEFEADGAVSWFCAGSRHFPRRGMRVNRQ